MMLAIPNTVKFYVILYIFLGFLIKTKTKSFAVYAATEGEKHEWMLHIERCVQDLLNSNYL